jgi:hypothetical protein
LILAYSSNYRIDVATRVPDRQAHFERAEPGCVRQYVAPWVRSGDWHSTADRAATTMNETRPTEIAEHPEIPYEEWIIAVKFFREYGIWSGHLGPPPGRSGCRVPVDLLESYGLVKTGRRSA